MKILAAFVSVCLGLLVLVVWALIPLAGDATTDSGPLPPLSSNVTHPVDSVEPPAAPRPPNSPLHREPEEPAKSSRLSPPLIAADKPPAVPAVAPESTVRWATDAARRRARQRFIQLREVSAADPHNEAALEAALELAGQLEWHNQAADLLARLVRLRPDAAALRFEFATLLMQLERWFEAIGQLRLVTEREPEDARAWYNLAIAHQALGHLGDARITWDRAIELMPENPDAYAHRGEVLLDLHAWSAAAADFETALRLEPQSPPIDATMNLSLALWKLGRLDDARDALRPLLEQYPEHVPALNRLALIAWDGFEADLAANATLADQIADYCQRSLAVDAYQPEIEALLDRALQAGN